MAWRPAAARLVWRRALSEGPFNEAAKARQLRYAERGPLREALAVQLCDRLDDLKVRRCAFPRAPRQLTCACQDRSVRVVIDAGGGATPELLARPGVERVYVVGECAGPLPPDARITRIPWQPALAISEPCDAAVSVLALHWRNDLRGALAALRAPLRADAPCLGVLWGSGSLDTLRSALILADLERLGGVTLRTSPLASVTDVARALTDAGYALPTLDSDALTLRYADAARALHDLRALGESCAAAARGGLAARQPLLAAMALLQHLYPAPADADSSDGDGGSVAVELTWHAVWWIGWRPAATQPRPKARGSAQYSLRELETGSGPGTRALRDKIARDDDTDGDGDNTKT